MAFREQVEREVSLLGYSPTVEVEAATPDELARLLTTIIRAERFGDGQLEHAFRSGLLVAITTTPRLYPA